MNTLVAGLDLGSTAVKLLIADETGASVALHSCKTPWREGSDGTITVSAGDLAAAVGQLLRQAAADLPPAGVRAIAVTGMGESGFLLDDGGKAVAPAFAWFDVTGGEAAAALPEELRAQFAGRTGLPWGVQVSAAKIAQLRAGGTDLRGTRWFSLPEFVVVALGGRPAAERSLAARTGLIDQDTGRPWPELVAALGLDDDCLPEVVTAGTPLGSADLARVPAAFAGAELTVAGHDHLVSAQSGGAGVDTGYHISMGTAEVLLRIVDAPLDFQARRRLGEALINCVPHVVPGQYAVVAGVKTGLLLRRALTMTGVSDQDARRRLDAEVLALQDTRSPADAGAGLTVSGARNDDGVLALRVATDDISPAAVVHAILEHSNEEIARLIEVLDLELPASTTAQLSGGWTSWLSVRRARSRLLPDLEVSAHPQDTAQGAVLCALRMLSPAPTHT